VKIFLDYPENRLVEIGIT